MLHGMKCLLLLFVIWGGNQPGFADGVHVKELRCEGRVNPEGIDAPNPVLSWKLVSGRRGAAQQAYQVLVASNLDLLAGGKANLWDSGKVASDQSIQIAYSGKPLVSGQRNFWSVRIWDESGNVSDWSSPASWSMGLLQPSDWSAHWIGLEEGPAPSILSVAQWIWYPDGQPVLAKPAGSCFFRREIQVPESTHLISAIYLTAVDNRMTVFVNGRQCAQMEDYRTALEINLLNFLQPGRNVIAVEAKNDGDTPNPAGLAGVIQMIDSNGDVVTIPTDTEWKASSRVTPDWNAIGFDDSSWPEAEVLGPVGMAPWENVATSDSRRLPARMLRRSFTLENPVQSAVIHMAGLGLSELYINGQKVGNAVLSPAVSEYDRRVYYVTHDVTHFLQQGSNAIGVWLGNGRFYAPRDSNFVNTKGYGYPRLLLQLDIQFQNGERQRIVSDSGWKITTQGPIIANNEFDGEEYDARLELPGWNDVGYDDSGWKNAVQVEPPRGMLSAQAIDPIRVTETLTPVSMTQTEPGVFVFDMGQNMVGWVRLKVKGKRGIRVILRYAETMRDGRLYFDNLRSAKCTDTYILKGGGDEIYEPRFTYHGFRYVEMRGYPGEPDVSVLEGKVVHDDLETVGTFHCSDETINRIYQNAVWGTRGNYRSMPTDCPQRDERQGWLGDRSEESRGEMSMFDAGRFYSKWMQDIEDSQRESGCIPDVAPPYYPIYTDNVTWPSTFIIIPGIVYEKTADLRVIERHYPAMQRWIGHMQDFIQDGLMPRDQYGDWCVPPESPELIHSNDPNRKTAGPLIGTAYFVHDLDLMQRYALLLGKEGDARGYQKAASEMRVAFDRSFWNEEKQHYDNGTQTSSVLALAFDLVPNEKKAAVIRHLKDSIMSKGSAQVGTGLIGMQWLMRTLSDHGMVDTAYMVATRREFPSWGYMIDQGATTIWELWNGNTADPGMNSHNHVMLLGDLVTWFYEYLAGIRTDPNKPGFKRIMLKPCVPTELQSVDASLNTIYGEIVSRWKRDQNIFIWEVVIPPNTSAEIHIPSKEKMTVIEEQGESVMKSKVIRFLRQDEGVTVVEVPSGRYVFQSMVP